MKDTIRRLAWALIGASVGVVIVGVIVVLGLIRQTQVDHSPAIEHAASAQEVRQAFAAVISCVANLDHITYESVYACEIQALEHHAP